jgi:shikimate kinase
MTGSTNRPRVVLVGPMGAGKTTVAGLLAERWGVPVRDTDEDVEKEAGKPVSEIFVDDGEPHFRELERRAVAAALAEHPGVLALGGGAVVAPETRQLLEGHCVAYLKVGLTDAVQRVGLGESRPLLSQALGGLRSRIKQLLDERGPVYAAVATVTVDTDGRTPEDVADEVARHVEAAP